MVLPLAVSFTVPFIVKALVVVATFIVMLLLDCSVNPELTVVLPPADVSVMTGPFSVRVPAVTEAPDVWNVRLPVPFGLILNAAADIVAAGVVETLEPGSRSIIKFVLAAGEAIVTVDAPAVNTVPALLLI